MAQQVLREIQDTAAQIQEQQKDIFINKEEGEDTSEQEALLAQLQETLEGLKEEYNSQLRNAQNMDLGKWVDEKVEDAKAMTVAIEGMDNPWLEAMCYASICQALQFRWSSTVMFVEDARRIAMLSPENTDAYDRFEAQQDRKEQMEKLWIAAEYAYKDAVERIEGEVNPPKLYYKSHDQALQDARTWFENRQAASKQSREKLVAVQNDLDKNQQELLFNALPATNIY